MSSELRHSVQGHVLLSLHTRQWILPRTDHSDLQKVGLPLPTHLGVSFACKQKRLFILLDNMFYNLRRASSLMKRGPEMYSSLPLEEWLLMVSHKI